MATPLTTNVLRAALRAARDVLAGAVTQGELAEHADDCASIEGAAAAPGVVADLAGVFVTFGESIRGGRQ